MYDFTFLTIDQLNGSNKLEIFNKYSISASITDFSILLGGAFDSDNLTGYYWTKDNDGDFVYQVECSGYIRADSIRTRGNGARPVLKYPSYPDFSEIISKADSDVLIVEYGEYPQTAASLEMQERLELAFSYKTDSLSLTSKKYTIDSGSLVAINPLSSIDEYVFEDGKKYVRVKANSCHFREEFILSNKGVYKNDDYVWIAVEPIRWIVDRKSEFVVAEKILFAGVAYDNIDFENTRIKKYLNECFSKDILPSKVNIKNNEENTRKVNPYNFDYENVSEEDIIRGMVESNISVFLHGQSGSGKSARVKQLDPDCEIIYLVNATPDSLNGKSVFNSNTNEMIDIPPTWYIKLKERCEKEPDKIHIVFLDELTNAPESIQSMAFNIVLNKEVNGKWKLPDNARIVAAGNEYEESGAARELIQPLFNRFAHVYIETTVENWLYWASTPIEEYKRLDYTGDDVPMKIHPSIYAYIVYKSYSNQDVLRTPYDGKTPNADPRKWEMASKVLYKTNNPEMLRSLIGDSLTKDFVMFTKRKVITVEDVINGDYTEEDLEMSVAEKYNTAVGLSSVSIEHIGVVRDFVKRLGPEICATFDTLWVHGDNGRLEKIAELKLQDMKVSQSIK